MLWHKLFLLISYSRIPSIEINKPWIKTNWIYLLLFLFPREFVLFWLAATILNMNSARALLRRNRICFFISMLYSFFLYSLLFRHWIIKSYIFFRIKNGWQCPIMIISVPFYLLKVTKTNATFLINCKYVYENQTNKVVFPALLLRKRRFAFYHQSYPSKQFIKIINF